MNQIETFISRLKDFSIINLKHHFNAEQNLFHFREFLNPRRKDELLSFRYSIIAAIGLIAHKTHPQINELFNLENLHRQLVEKGKQCDSLQDLGLLLWLDAQEQAKFANEILKQIEKVQPQKNIHAITTYELAWLLTGLSYILLNNPALQSSHRSEYIQKIYHHLNERFQPRTHLFYHLATDNPKYRLRGAISDFADQIYSIYANLCYYELTGEARALEIAVNCGQKLVALQGPQGEWWWLYNTNTGHVAYRYPVYSVHQDGMAPMVLMKLIQITQQDWKPALYKSLHWLFHENGCEKINFNTQQIIRGIQIAPACLKHVAVLFSALNLNTVQESIIYRFFKKIDLINEFRPYHLGWILYFIGYWERMTEHHQSLKNSADFSRTTNITKTV